LVAVCWLGCNDAVSCR